MAIEASRAMNQKEKAALCAFILALAHYVKTDTDWKEAVFLLIAMVMMGILISVKQEE